MGVPDLFSCWMKSYRSNRTYQVGIKSQCSYTFTSTSGVPQGSKLGPLLFQIYINDLPSILPLDSYLAYADDLKIFTVVKDTSDCQRLQEMLDLIGDWCIGFGCYVQLNARLNLSLEHVTRSDTIILSLITR